MLTNHRSPTFSLRRSVPFEREAFEPLNPSLRGTKQEREAFEPLNPSLRGTKQEREAFELLNF
jgi:hypothetical protein